MRVAHRHKHYSASQYCTQFIPECAKRRHTTPRSSRCSESRPLTRLAAKEHLGLRLRQKQHSRRFTGPLTRAAEEEPSTSAPSISEVLTLPTLLTLVRVAAVPALIAVWFGSDHPGLYTTLIFVLSAVTDFLDGYLARSMGSCSAFGAFLDPVADKLMVSAVLILLSSRPLAAGPWAGNAWLLPTLSSAIIGREITMSALREWAASSGGDAYRAVAVSSWGKWKTASQMVSLTLLLLVSQGAAGAPFEAAALAGVPLLCVASLLTLWSLLDYFRGAWRHLL